MSFPALMMATIEAAIKEISLSYPIPLFDLPSYPISFYRQKEHMFV